MSRDFCHLILKTNTKLQKWAAVKNKCEGFFLSGSDDTNPDPQPKIEKIPTLLNFFSTKKNFQKFFLNSICELII